MSAALPARELIAPLLSRQRNGKAGFVLARHEGAAPAPDFLDEIQAQLAGEGLRPGLVRFSDLGDSPLAGLLARRETGPIDVLLVLFDPEALRADAPAAVDRIAALNFRRRDFVEAGLLAVFFVPAHEGFRLLYEHASNFLDFRLRIVDVPSAGLPAAETPLPPANLPFAPLGPLFVGREAQLEKVRESLNAAGALAITQPLAIQGLGGVGKTRLAVEYGHRHRRDYRSVLFVRADTPLDLRVNLGDLAGLLQLPEAESTDQNARYAAVLAHLATHPGWLLLIDNADTEEAALAVERLLPRLGQGHVIVTSRFRRWSGALAGEALSELSHEEAVRYLLLKTRGLRREEVRDREEAEALAGRLADRLGNLPLALEQAGAHIATHGLSFREYFQLWQEGEAAAMAWYQAAAMPNYPAPVAVTLLSSFAALRPQGRALLWLLSWFAPAPLPEALFSGEAGRELLDGALTLASEDTADGEENDPAAALENLDRHCLISRDAGGMVSIHRLVQEVARSRIAATKRPAWVGLDLALTAAFLAPDPPPDDVRSWPRWEPLRDHAATLILHAEALGMADKASVLMGGLATFFRAKALYREAEPLHRRALALDEARLGSEHPDVAACINDLALLLKTTNNLVEAEPLMRRALAIDEASLGPEHPNVARDLNNLAQLLHATNRLAEAEPLMRRALAIDEASLGPEHPNVARDLNNLAQLLQDTKRLAEAAPLMRRALAIDEASLGPEHPNVARDLNNLALLFKATKRLDEAEPLMRRALVIDEASLGPEHPEVAIDLNNLALLLQATKRLAEAEPLMRRALAIDEAAFGPEHPNVARDLNNLALLLKDTNHLAEAEPLMRRCVSILHHFGQQTGHRHPHMAVALNNYQALLAGLGEPEEECRSRLAAFSD